MTKNSAPLSLIAESETGPSAAARVPRAEVNFNVSQKFMDIVGYAERTDRQVRPA
jgi:hypothetical protein